MTIMIIMIIVVVVFWAPGLHGRAARHGDAHAGHDGVDDPGLYNNKKKKKKNNNNNDNNSNTAIQYNNSNNTIIDTINVLFVV